MEPLKPNKIYHIYNHVNGNENLFRENKNYGFFFEKYKKYIAPIADTYCYCLLPNHIHLLVQITEQCDVESEIFYSKQFSNFFSSYTQSYNKVYNRRGSLFMKNFKRKPVEDNMYLLKLVNYIHFNPVVHGFVEQPGDWKYSSFNAICRQSDTLVCYREVLEWFDGFDNFLYNHRFPLEV